MIYFQNNGNVREKYEITIDTDALQELTKQIAKKTGELRIRHDETKQRWIPRSDNFTIDDNDIYHYIDDVKTRLSPNKGKEWDHYDEWEVELYYCDYKDYTCPEIVNFIREICIENKEAIQKLFNRDFKSITRFPTVKEKIASLEHEIDENEKGYQARRAKKLEELQKKYSELDRNPTDIERKLKELRAWANKMEQEIQDMDEEHEKEQQELKKKLEDLLSIEGLNENQDEVSKYIELILSFVQIRLVDSISLDLIKRVREFQSQKIEEDSKSKKLVNQSKVD